MYQPATSGNRSFESATWSTHHRGSPRTVGGVIEEEPRTGPADVSRSLTDAMERAGVHPAYVHAVRACGFVYTEENASTLTSEQVARWNQAMDDWFAQHPE